MNPTSLYITTSRLVFQGDIVAELQDLNRLLPYLRKSLSCAVCCKLLVEPHSPSTGDCQHHICRVCVGKHKKLKPACRFCKHLLQYRENTQLRLLLQCYKSICTFIRSRPVYADICKCAPNQPGGSGAEGGGASTSGSSGTTPNSLMDLIEEGAAFVDDFKCNSGLSKSAYSILPCIFPPPVVSVPTPTAPKPIAVVPPSAPCCSKATNKPKPSNKTASLAENVKLLQEKKKVLRKIKSSRQPKQPEQEQQSATQERKKRNQAKQKQKQIKQEQQQQQPNQALQQKQAQPLRQQQTKPMQQSQPLQQCSQQFQQHQEHQGQQKKGQTFKQKASNVSQQQQQQRLVMQQVSGQQEQHKQPVLQQNQQNKTLQRKQQQPLQQQSQNQCQQQQSNQPKSQPQQPQQVSHELQQKQLVQQQQQQQQSGTKQPRQQPKQLKTQVKIEQKPELQSQQYMLPSQQPPQQLMQQPQVQKPSQAQQQQLLQQQKSVQLQSHTLKPVQQQPALPVTGTQMMAGQKMMNTSPAISVRSQKTVPMLQTGTIKQETIEQPQLPLGQQPMFQLQHKQQKQQQQIAYQNQQSMITPQVQSLQSAVQMRKQQETLEYLKENPQLAEQQDSLLKQHELALQRQQQQQQLQIAQRRQQLQQQQKLSTQQQTVAPKLPHQMSIMQQSRMAFPGSMSDVVIRPNANKINSSIIRNVLPARVGPTIIHAESLANRPASGMTATGAATSKSALVPAANMANTPLLSQPIIKNSCVPTTPRIVNITTPQEIKFEAAPIKTVSSGTTMYSVLYAESGNKFTIKRKPDPVSAAKPAQNGQQAKLATMVSNSAGLANSSRAIIPAKALAGDVDQTKLTTVQKAASAQQPIVLQFRPPQARSLQLPLSQQQQQQQQQQQHATVVQQQQQQQKQSSVHLQLPQQNAPMVQQQIQQQQQQQYQLQHQQKLTTPSQQTVVALAPQQQQNFRSLIIQQQQQQQMKTPQQAVQQPPSQPPPSQQQSVKRKGCRCGNATPTPGKLTCCGQRCPCYVDSKSCVDCKCRGCRNPHRADGLKIRRSLTELLQQYNAPATTTATATATNDTLSSGAAGSSVPHGPTITAVTYSINALKPTSASTSVANGSTKVKVISAGQHQILHTTAKAPPATAVVKTGAGGGRTRTNGGVGVCLVPKTQSTTVPTCGTITIRPFANNGFTSGTTTTISYLPSATQSSTATASASDTMPAGTYASPLSRTMSQPSPASVRLSKPPARTSTVTSGSYVTLASGSAQPVDRDWTRLGAETIPGTNTVAKPFTKQSLANSRAPYGMLDTERDRTAGMGSRKPDALLSQSSVAMMPVTASPSSASFCSSPTVWPSLLPSNLFGGSVPGSNGTGSPVGSGTNAPELSTLSAYDMNSFASIMLDDGVIDLCDDLELNSANLISLD